MIWYQCHYCRARIELFRKIISHLVEEHPEKCMKFTRLDGPSTRLCNYNVIPEICREQGREIEIKDGTEKIHLSRPNIAAKDSPYSKVVKTGKSSLEGNIIVSNPISERYEDNIDTEDNADDYHDIISLVPGVLEELKRIGKVEEYLSFHRLVNEGVFPLDNIAFLLFLDVVHWFSLNSYTSAMRYSNEVKTFWRTGLRLFHGRFLMFMSGPKSRGEILKNEVSPGLCKSENSKINFVVPDRKLLQDDRKFVDGKEPGIFHTMIETFAKTDPEQNKTYKICVDGKKINPSSKGEVRLWGYEDSPTFNEKQKRLNEEKDAIGTFKEIVIRLQSFDHLNTTDCSEIDKTFILDGCRKTVQLLSGRLKDLRQMRVKKDIFLRKLVEKCQTDWRNSQFAMVISSIKTSIYRIENTTHDLLYCIENLCRDAGIIGSAVAFLHSEKRIPLATQGNHVCLSDTASSVDCPQLVKQRSEIWHSLRKKSIVTGSTINIALGLAGLKKQKEFIEEKSGKREPKEMSDQLQQILRHRTENEINAVSTLTSLFLPAFLPDALFFEEGCYLSKDGERTVLVVSPDGSIRDANDESKVTCGVEIKCPIPGKMFTTDVHYAIPHYYVPQVLSEMYSLNTEHLLFVSYSKDSTTTHLVQFDAELWRDMYEEVKAITSESIPKKLSATVKGLKTRISKFCETNVQLVAEVPSCVADMCDHSTFSEPGRIYHEKRPVSDVSVKLCQLERLLLKCEELIDACHEICAQRASEVLVFLLADLDRMHKAEIPHAFPIAFGLKGYSMRTEIMRKMINDVLAALYMKGIYTPVVSYDGQWANLRFKQKMVIP